MNELDVTKLNIDTLAGEIRQQIDRSRSKVAVQVNSAITMLYWNVGCLIRREVLKEQRAGYGKHIFSELGKQMTAAYGRGWGEQQLRHCVRCAEVLRTRRFYTHCVQN